MAPNLMKAQAQQAAIKATFYGPPGSGKTLSSLLIAEGLVKLTGKRIALYDTEHGSDFYSQAIKERKVHPEAFDFDAMYTRSLLDVLESVRALDTNVYGAVIVDSLTHLWEAAMAAYEGKMTSQDSIPQHAWGKIKKPYKELIQRLMDSPVHMFLLGRQKDLFAKNPDGSLGGSIGVGMQAEKNTAHEPHLCCRFESLRKQDGTYSDVLMICEKDRTGILHGRTVVNPSFATFGPILPYLGETQAQSEDPEEVAARDSELLNDQDHKAKDKAEKSRALFNEFNARIIGAASMEDLNKIAEEAKKAKRYILGEHSAALNMAYMDKNKQLASSLAPSEI